MKTGENTSCPRSNTAQWRPDKWDAAAGEDVSHDDLDLPPRVSSGTTVFAPSSYPARCCHHTFTHTLSHPDDERNAVLKRCCKTLDEEEPLVAGRGTEQPPAVHSTAACTQQLVRWRKNDPAEKIHFFRVQRDDTEGGAPTSAAN
ncbi:unnamed protein product [Heligmosomoides polygyrus]|uniref:Uncharacterized protein n=1 Tax=Heligmosomoides polygyrus TaxID=6339 RepID=A0A183GBR6_HELPZ|nr:unnamed protein product [Heligmosomoides polygyrus]